MIERHVSLKAELYDGHDVRSFRGVHVNLCERACHYIFVERARERGGGGGRESERERKKEREKGYSKVVSRFAAINKRSSLKR